MNVLVTRKYEEDSIKNEGAKMLSTFSPLYDTKMLLTVTRVSCVLGIKNDRTAGRIIKTQGKRPRLPIESHVAFWPINTAYANERTTKQK